jgi:hypothetical protein
LDQRCTKAKRRERREHKERGLGMSIMST